MASMASMVVPLEWLNLIVAKPKRGDERADGLTLKIEGALTVALVMASVVAAWMDPVAHIDGFDGTDSFVGFDGGFDGSAGGDGGVIGSAEVH